MCFQNNIPSNDKNHPLHFTSRIQINSAKEIQSKMYFHKANQDLVHVESSVHQIIP